MFGAGKFELFTPRITKSLPRYDEASGELLRGSKNIESVLSCAQTCSPYLENLCEKWPQIIASLKEQSPEQIYGSITKELFTKTRSYEQLKACLRHAKQQVHLLAALCDLAGVWDWSLVTAALSDFADKSMQLLIESLSKEMDFTENERGPVPGLFVLALGKYGAHELNYSSDIDLIVFYDPEYLELPQTTNPERMLIRFVKKLMRGFDEILPEGYIFRTDLRLRPDPRANAVAVSTLTAERYYETLGQNWERAAMIKARYCGGDRQAADEFIKNVLTPFIWRRSLDYAAIADIHSIKRQIQGGANISDISAAGHDLKLGLGGIREIEFYTQVQQLILGGRNKELRAPRTLDALEALLGGGYAKPMAIKNLVHNYASYRNLEHRVQMYADNQTHIWPADKIERMKLMAMSGGHDLKKFETKLAEKLTAVHQYYSDLFPGEEDLSTAKGSLIFTGVAAENITLQTLQAYGFRRRAQVWQLMADWLGGRVRATRTQRARELLTRLAPRIIEACGEAEAPDNAFFNFSEFIVNLNSGITLFSLFLNKPETLVSVIEMLAIAPRLASTLSTQPALIDAMVEPDFVKRTARISPAHYSRILSADMDFETALDAIRRAVHEDQFSLMASMLKLQNIDSAGQIFSGIAQAAICALLPKAGQEVELKHGLIKGSYAVVGMGKLGSQEMGLKSDLDLMLVYDPHKDEITDAQTLYNKLARRFITALSSVTSAGRLYEVDMALRPSGRSGPLAVSLDAFNLYYQNKAWTWEYMALCRARVVAASSNEFATQMEQAVKFAFRKDFDGQLAADVLDMHRRLARDKPAKGNWDVKGVLGGLRDIEFIGQYLLLKHKPTSPPRGLDDVLTLAKQCAWLTEVDAKVLQEAAQFYHNLIQITAISIDGIFDRAQSTASVRKLISASVFMEDFSQVENHYAVYKENVERIFKAVIV